jgi:hypothetical protein
MYLWNSCRIQKKGRQGRKNKKKSCLFSLLYHLILSSLFRLAFSYFTYSLLPSFSYAATSHATNSVATILLLQFYQHLFFVFFPPRSYPPAVIAASFAFLSS